MKTETFTTAIAFTSLLTLGGTSFAADANDAYHRAFPGDGGTSYSTPDTAIMGKAAFGRSSSDVGSSSIDGNAAYRSAFHGD